tara:strand:+ start:372 stop:518 length:147 start_codon:yes stop_codon:yes gene_type:complete
MFYALYLDMFEFGNVCPALAMPCEVKYCAVPSVDKLVKDIAVASPQLL